MLLSSKVEAAARPEMRMLPRLAMNIPLLEPGRITWYDRAPKRLLSFSNAPLDIVSIISRSLAIECRVSNNHLQHRRLRHALQKVTALHKGPDKVFAMLYQLKAVML